MLGVFSWMLEEVVLMQDIGMRPCSDPVALVAVVSVSREEEPLLTVLVASAVADKRGKRMSEN